MISTGGPGPRMLQGDLSERPSPNRVPFGTQFISNDTSEMFICVRAGSESAWRPIALLTPSPSTRGICENCGGPHEPHEKHCSWCKRRLR